MRISGPDLQLAARPALSLTLALHELGTNAVKYGALSGAGVVEISWSLAGDEGAERFAFVWRERGGPEVAPPSRRGFGTRLIETVASEFGGAGRLAYEPTGVVWTVEAPLERIVEPATA